VSVVNCCSVYDEETYYIHNPKNVNLGKKVEEYYSLQRRFALQVYILTDLYCSLIGGYDDIYVIIVYLLIIASSVMTAYTRNRMLKQALCKAQVLEAFG
jgi:hypothetical protein